MADYLKDIRKYPAKSQVNPGDIFKQIPDGPPVEGESIESIMKDVDDIILPGITHWQHPNFHAYFNGNSSYPSLLGEMLTATIGAQCMLWETSPAATELEEKMMDWLKSLLDLPSEWKGVIQDGASVATLTAVLTARESKSQWNINKLGFKGSERFAVYCSEQAHSSVDKAIRIAGIGDQALRKVAVDDRFALIPELLEDQIVKDESAGFKPLLVVATLGTTGSTATDPVSDIAKICQQHKIWLHVDAAWAGTAMMLPEYKWMNEGLNLADSFVFNPHKWMFTNFDCSAYFVRDAEILQRTFSLVPEYLKTQTKGVNNYSEWGIQLGRRFRALKLWFVLRNFGVEGLRKKVRQHIAWAQELATEINSHPEFQLLVPAPLGTVCFRHVPIAHNQENELDTLNKILLEKINQRGLYLTHTTLNGIFTIRLVVGQTYTEKRDIDYAWNTIKELANALNSDDHQN